ncbi:MAG: OmpA family protein [Phycisphaerales bacterium]|nr:OmpA family protein [Phycisphaerales bacterium]
MIPSISKKLGLTLLSAVMLSAFTGCKTVSQRDYDAAIEENTTLRERIAALQSSTDQAAQANQSYIDQNNELRAENQRLTDMLATAQANPNTGFEGIDGVDVGRRNGGEIVVGVEADVLFNSGSADLRKDARATLDRVAGVLKSNYASNTVRVEGYTDTDKLVKTKDKWKTNENLSAARALAVESYLVGKGVDNDMVYSAAFGPSNPKATKKDSRRVEIVILGN